jgi:hypothetical protein
MFHYVKDISSILLSDAHVKHGSDGGHATRGYIVTRLSVSERAEKRVDIDTESWQSSV